MSGGAKEVFVGVCTTLVTSAILYMAYGVSELNIKMAVVIEQVGGHEKRITKLEGN